MEFVIGLLYWGCLLMLGVKIMGFGFPEVPASHADLVSGAFRMFALMDMVFWAVVLWLFFGEIPLRLGFRYLFGYRNPVADAEAFAVLEHPLIWTLHLAGYFVAIAVLFIAFFLSFPLVDGKSEVKRFFGKALRWTTLGFFPFAIYWHYAGMEVVASWFA